MNLYLTHSVGSRVDPDGHDIACLQHVAGANLKGALKRTFTLADAGILGKLLQRFGRHVGIWRRQNLLTTKEPSKGPSVCQLSAFNRSRFSCSSLRLTRRGVSAAKAAKRLIGGRPPCHPEGANQPFRPRTTRWASTSAKAM